jgi:dynein heavy chain
MRHRQVLRVFYDRLVDDKDRAWFLAYLKTVMTEQLAADFDKLFAHLREGSGGKQVGFWRMEYVVRI